jgi:hypothetical protein
MVIMVLFNWKGFEIDNNEFYIYPIMKIKELRLWIKAKL